MLPCQIGETTISKRKFLCEVKRKKEWILSANNFKELFFYITFGFISGINTQDQVKISSIDNDANSRENQVDAANMQNKLESETRPDEGNNSLS